MYLPLTARTAQRPRKITAGLTVDGWEPSAKHPTPQWGKAHTTPPQEDALSFGQSGLSMELSISVLGLSPASLRSSFSQDVLRNLGP